MCGIVGFITTDKGVFREARKSFFRDALVMDTLRGWDSTGVFTVSPDGETYWLKQTSPGPEFVQSESYHKNVAGAVGEAYAAIGHNRAATIGKVVPENAHPFEEGAVTLVHNGTLTDTRNLPHQNADIKVDSHLIAYNLSQAAPEEAKDILEKLDGAFALIWYDSRDNSLNVARNSRRPLHIGSAKYHDTLYIMSEADMLQACMARNKMDVETIYSISTERWLKFKDGSLVPESTEFRAMPEWSGYATGPNYYNNTWQRRYNDDDDAAEAWGDLLGNKRTPPDPFRPMGDGQPPAKVDALSEAQARILIDGHWLDIPRQHQQMLDWYDVGIRDCMEFVPEYWEKTGPGMCNVHGKVHALRWDDFEIPCVLYGLASSVAKDCMEYPWKVRATGIKWERKDIDEQYHSTKAPAKDTPVIIAKVVTNGLMRPKEHPKSGEDAAQEVSFHTCEGGEEVPLDEVENNMVPGPKGVFVCNDEFLHLAQDGCCMCSGNIDLADAYAMMWVGDRGDQPLCPECVEEAFEQTGGAY